MLNFLSSFSPERNDGNSSNVVESDQKINVYVSIDPSTTEKTELECEPITPENSPTCLAWTNLVGFEVLCEMLTNIDGIDFEICR